ncbi:MAG: hypothetical protein FWC16_00770 [Defluviitaleaceae bacterium]|nr:hypothetical protein [Defluviitaleaceae bacterium]MCL2273437.1 hypothetical protein [Defluviitaleaceae bacterium]
MEFDFRELVGELAKPMQVIEETGGFYDHDNGGEWKPTTQERTVNAAAFNITRRDISGYGLNYGEGGTYTTEDIKIYIHEALAMGASAIWKGNPYTVSSQIDHSDYAHGLRTYLARRAGKIQNAPTKE